MLDFFDNSKDPEGKPAYRAKEDEVTTIEMWSVWVHSRIFLCDTYELQYWNTRGSLAAMGSCQTAFLLLLDTLYIYQGRRCVEASRRLALTLP